MKHKFFSCDALPLIIICLLLITCPVPAQNTPVPRKTNLPSTVQVKFPNTVTGRQTEKWLQAFNSNDYETLRAFYSATSPAKLVDEDVAYAYSIYLDTRGFDFYRIEQSGEYELRFLARERVSGQWDLVRLQYAEQAPYHQTNFGVAYVYPPSDLPPEKKLTAGEITRQLDSIMKKLSAADVFSGAVLVAKDDRIIFKKAYGLANKAYGVPNRPDTKFNLGSITKVFTAIAIAQLAQQGKLSFTDTISKYLPDYPNKAVSEKITIQQLLTHTSGIGRTQGQLGARGNALRLRTVSSWFQLFADSPPLFEPGARYRYSNEGYIVLGAIVEKASGENYYDYVKEHIFKPAAMTGTDFYELNSDIPNLAVGYTRNGLIARAQLEARKNNLLLNFVKGEPAGGAYSTVEDLLKFKIALFGHKLLDPDHTNLIITGQVETGEPGSKQAYGFVDEIVRGMRRINHSGAVQGGESRFEIYPGSGYTVVSLCNYDYQVVHRRLRDLITQNGKLP